MPEGTSAIRPVVVCPLEFERRRLLHAGLAEVCDVQCCGPGAGAIRRWCTQPRRPIEVVILAGLAGALGGDVAPGAARVIDEVTDATGEHTWPPPFPMRRKRTATAEKILVTSSSRVVSESVGKHELRRTSGAQLVDLEAVTFARVAIARGWRWGIVRGVSDGPNEALPPDIDDWVSPAGRLRGLRAAGWVAMHPGWMGTLMRVRRNSVAALDAAARVIRQLVAEDEANVGD